jgi:hypothetical protein
MKKLLITPLLLLAAPALGEGELLAAGELK